MVGPVACPSCRQNLEVVGADPEPFAATSVRDGAAARRSLPLGVDAPDAVVRGVAVPRLDHLAHESAGRPTGLLDVDPRSVGGLVHRGVMEYEVGAVGGAGDVDGEQALLILAMGDLSSM